MSEIKKCENCGNENIEIINHFKGHYLCGKCGRDTEKLYEIEHDAEIRAKSIDEFTERLKGKYEHCVVNDILMNNDVMSYTNSCSVFESFVDEIAEEMRGAING